MATAGALEMVTMTAVCASDNSISCVQAASVADPSAGARPGRTHGLDRWPRGTGSADIGWRPDRLHGRPDRLHGRPGGLDGRPGGGWPHRMSRRPREVRLHGFARTARLRGNTSSPVTGGRSRPMIGAVIVPAAGIIAPTRAVIGIAVAIATVDRITAAIGGAACHEQPGTNEKGEQEGVLTPFHITSPLPGWQNPIFAGSAAHRCCRR